MSEQKSNPNYAYNFEKIAIIGDSGVGKSNLLYNMLNGSFTPSFAETKGMSQETIYTDLDNPPKRIKARVFDVSGREKISNFMTISDWNLHGTQLVYLVYDITDEQS